ncbi:hypothetical protein JL722_4501 [Aureococcus anophagefferens]|nr:hypothetical protein JL722_4501 [Aureococcus anophagefferens]
MHTDKKTGKPYYHHAGSGKTTWVKPPGCADDVENAPLRENGAVSQPRSTPGRRDLPRDMTEPRSTARAEPRAPMSRRSSDSLSNLKLSMRSKRNKDPSDAELRTRSASEVLELARNESDSSTNGAAARARPLRRRPPRGRRPEWNDNFAHTDRRTGNVFYRNEARGESTWTRPAAPNRDDRSPPRRTGAAAPKLPAATKGPDSESRHRTLWKPKSARGDRSDDDDDDGRRDDAADDGHAKPKSQPRADDRGGSRPTGGYGAVPADASAAPDGGAAELDDACVVAGAMTRKALDGLEKRHGQRCCPKCAPKKARKTFNAAAHRADGFDGDEQMCPHCSRTFNEKAAERHIPKCQSIKAKPKSLARGGGRTIGSRR